MSGRFTDFEPGVGLSSLVHLGVTGAQVMCHSVQTPLSGSVPQLLLFCLLFTGCLRSEPQLNALPHRGAASLVGLFILLTQLSG